MVELCCATKNVPFASGFWHRGHNHQKLEEILGPGRFPLKNKAERQKVGRAERPTQFRGLRRAVGASNNTYKIGSESRSLVGTSL